MVTDASIGWLCAGCDRLLSAAGSGLGDRNQESAGGGTNSPLSASSTAARRPRTARSMVSAAAAER